MHMLDRDHDRRLDFTEFLLMIFKLTMACNKVLSKEYCKASGSKKHRRGHRHQEEESETEEDEEDTPEHKSGYRHSSWSEGEEHGYSSGHSRGTVKRRHGSNSRRLGRQGHLSSSGNQERSQKRYHRSSSGHSWSSGKERHGFSSGELRERINKSHVSPSREFGEEYESGSGSKSWERKGHGGLSCGLEISGHESNSTQSRSRGQKLGSSRSCSGDSRRQSHACGYSNSSGCGRPQNASNSCQSHRFGGQVNQSSYIQSGCQSGINGGQGHDCVSGGQPSGCGQPESNSCSQSYSQRGYGARENGQPQNCGGQQRTGSSQSSFCGQYESGGSQSCSNGQHEHGSCGRFSNSSSSNEFSKCGKHRSGSGQFTSCEQHGTGLSQSSGFEQQVAGSSQTCSQYGSRSSQSSGYDEHGSSSGKTSGFGQHRSGSGHSSGFGQHGSGSGQSFGFGQHGSGSGQSSGFGQHESRSCQSSYGQHGSGSSQSSGYGQHASRQTSGFGQHGLGSGQSTGFGQYGSGSGQSSGFGQHGSGSGQSSGFGQYESRSGQSSYGQHSSSSSQSSGYGQHGSRQTSGFGQHGSGSGQSTGFGQYGSGLGQSSGFGQHGSGSGQSSGFGQHESTSGQSSYGQHGFGSSQSSGCGQHGLSSGQTSGFGQHELSSGQSSSFGQHGSGSGQSSGFRQHGSGSGQSSGFGQHESRSHQSSYGPHGSGSGQSSGYGQHGSSSGQTSGFGQQGSSSSQYSGFGQHGSGLGQSSGFGQHGTGSGQFSGFGQHESRSHQSSYGQHGSGSSQSSGYGQHGSSSGHTTGFGQHRSSSGQYSGFGQHGSGLGQSSGFGQHGTGSGQSSGFGQHESRSHQSSYGQHGSGSSQSSSYGQHGSSSGQTSGFGQHRSGSGQSSGFGQYGLGSGQSSGFGQHGSGTGQSSGFARHEYRSGQSSYGQHGTGSSQSSGCGQRESGSGPTTGFGQHVSGSDNFSSSGQHISGSDQSTGFGQYGSGSGQSTGLGQVESQQVASGSTVHGRQETTHGQTINTARHSQSGQGQYTQTGSRVSRRRRSSQSENIDSEVHSRVSHRHSEHIDTQVGSHYPESGSTVHRRQGTTHGQRGDTTRHSHSGHGQSTQTGSRTTGRQRFSHSDATDSEVHSGVSHRPHSQEHTHGQDGSQLGESQSTVHERHETTYGQTGDATGHGYSGHGQSTQIGSRTSGRRGSGHSESSDTEVHSGGSHRPHSQEQTHGQARSQHGESRSTVHERHGTTHGQTGDTTRYAHYHNGQSAQRGSRTTGRGSGHSEYSDSELYSGGSHTYSGQTHGQAGSQHGDPNREGPGQLEEGDLATLSTVTVKGTRGSPTHIQDTLMAKLDPNMESQDLPFMGDKELHKDRQQIPLDMASLVMASPYRQVPGQLEEGDLATVSTVTVKGTQGSHTHIQDTLTAKLDLNMESQDPQVMGDRELLMDRQEIPLDMPTMVMDNPHREGPGQLEEGDLATVSTVTVKGTQGSHTHIQDTLMAKPDLNMESQNPQFTRDNKLLMDRQEIPLDMPTMVMDNPHREGPGQLEKGDLATVSTVTVKGTQGSHTHIQDTLMAKPDLNMESQNPQFTRDNKLLMDRQEIPLDMPTMVMDNPHRQGPGQLEEGDLATVSTVIVKGTQGAPTHIQDTLMAKSDPNMESQDLPFMGDKEPYMDRQEIPLDMASLVMESPYRQVPGRLEEGNLATVSTVTVKGTRGAPTQIQDTLMAKPDSNMESQDLPFMGDRELHMDRQQIPLDMASLVMASPYRQVPGQLEEGDLATVSTVTVKGTQGSHTHIQDTLTAKLDLNMESQDPQVMGDRELLMDRQEIPLDMPTMVMDNPHREGPGQLEEGDLATVSTVTVKGTQGSHTHIQDTLMAKPDLNMESQNPQFTKDNKLLMDRQEISLNMATLVMDKPHRQGPGQLEEGDLATVSTVTVKGTQGSHTHIQDILMAKPDPNMESQDLPFMGDREPYMDRQEIPLDMASLVMDNPHRQGPGQLEEGDLATVSTVTVKGTQGAPTHIQDTLMAKPDPNMESQDLLFMGDREPYMDRQEIPLDMASLVMDNPHRQGPGQLEEGDLATVSTVTVKGTQGSHTHIQDTLMDKPDLNMESQDPQVMGDRELLMDRQEIPLDMPTMVMDNPHREGPGQLEEGDLATLSTVTVKGTQGSPTHIQDTLMAKPDPNMESQDLPFMGDRELYMDRQEIPLDMTSLVTDNPHRQGPGQLEEGDLATVSTVTVKGTQGAHTHIQDTLMAKLDPNMESQDLPFMGDKELHKDRQQIPLDMASLVMASPYRQVPGQLEEGDLATVSTVTVKGTQGSHTHIQDTLTAKLDLNMESQDPQVMGDRELLMDRQEIPLDMPTMVMDNPHREGPGQLEEGDLATVSTVTVKGTQGSHTHIQDTLMAKPDLNMESQNPQFTRDNKLLMDRQEIPLDMPTMVMDKPHRQGPGQREEGDLSTVSTVIVKRTQGSHTHIQNTLMDKPDLNMESQDPQVMGDRELYMDRQEIPLDMPTMVMESPYRQVPGQLEEGDLATVSTVTVKGTQGSHTHIQDILMAKPDPNMESQDLPFMGDRESYMDRQEIPLDMTSLVKDNPHRQGPGQLEEGDLATVSTVTV
ncbi:filaggrin-2 [Macaca fascicularis]|uniref:filaggrin-2 n=1 Tax=Macaca fascicularis TaxID=9541 RepID=UPI003D15D1CA